MKNCTTNYIPISDNKKKVAIYNQFLVIELRRNIVAKNLMLLKYSIKSL